MPGDFLLCRLLVRALAQNGHMGLVGIGHLVFAQVVQGVLIGLVALLTAGHVEDFHATGLGILQKLEGTWGRRRAIVSHPPIPGRIVKELLALGDQKPPVGIAAEDGVVDIADDRRFLVPRFLIGQCLVQACLGDVETLIVQRAELRGSLAPGHCIDQQVGVHGARLCTCRLGIDHGRGQQQKRQGDRIFEMGHWMTFLVIYRS
ncbi:hypothetical protein D9M71_503540 [compost metagenome]